MENRLRQRENIRYKKNVGLFMDADMLADLEPSLNKHFLGTHRENDEKTRSLNSSNSQNNSFPPPLPETSSSSDIYTKKIASFKRKLKTLKGINHNNNNHNADLKKDKLIIKIPKELDNPNWNSKSISTFNSNTIRNTDVSNLKNSTSNNNSNNISEIDMEHNSKLSFQLNKETFETSSPVISMFNSNSSDLQMRVRKSSKENKCSICDIQLDTLYNIQDVERIIELKCDHMVHEECLLMELEINLSLNNIILSDRSMIIDYLPPCGLCNDKMKKKIIPKDDNLLTHIFTRIITSNLSGKSSKLFIDNSVISVPTPLTPTFTDNSKFNDTEQSSSSFYSSLNQSILINNTNINDNTNDAVNNLNTTNILKSLHENTGLEGSQPDSHRYSSIKSEIKVPKSTFYKKHNKKPSRGSFISGTSAIISSVDNEPPVNGILKENIPDNLTKQKLLDGLIALSTRKLIDDNEDSDFTLTDEFIKSLGKFRVVDKMSLIDSSTTSNNSESPAYKCYCYLFEHMLIALNSETYKFKLISINLSTFIDTFELGTIILKTSKNAKTLYKLLFNDRGLELKWKNALTNMKQHIENRLVTSTLKGNEFDALIANQLQDFGDVETIGTLQSYIGHDGYRRLATGVCPRFYESTINSFNLREKPANAIIVINQTKYIPSSIVPIKNITKSLLMIGIDVSLIFCSTSVLSMNSNVLDNYGLKKNELKKKGDLCMLKIDEYQQNLHEKNLRFKAATLADEINHYVNITNVDESNIITIMISNATLNNIESIPTTDSILIEIGLEANKKSNREDINDLASWDDIMEVICIYCSLEFNESDFYMSSEDRDDDDEEDYEEGDSNDQYLEINNGFI
jgi:hypothetical protein